jgi:hypothetical protein
MAHRSEAGQDYKSLKDFCSLTLPGLCVPFCLVVHLFAQMETLLKAWNKKPYNSFLYLCQPCAGHPVCLAHKSKELFKQSDYDYLLQMAE